METKRQELEARIGATRTTLTGLRVKRVTEQRVFISTAYTDTRIAHHEEILAAAERELAAMDAKAELPGRFCGSCLYYDEPGRCVCFDATQADFDPACADWVARIKPEPEAQESDGLQAQLAQAKAELAEAIDNQGRIHGSLAKYPDRRSWDADLQKAVKATECAAAAVRYTEACIAEGEAQ